MIVYRLDFIDSHEGTVVSWHESKKKAEEHVPEVIAEHGYEKANEADEFPIKISQVSIPELKQDLLWWLNHNFTRYNG